VEETKCDAQAVCFPDFLLRAGGVAGPCGSIIFYRRGLPLLSGSGKRYTPFRNESARIEPLGQESCQRAYRCTTRFGGSPKKPPRIYVAESSLPYFVPLLHLVLTVLQIFIEIESIARSFRSGKSNAFSFNHL
jgi:hypothetical protein